MKNTDRNLCFDAALIVLAGKWANPLMHRHPNETVPPPMHDMFAGYLAAAGVQHFTGAEFTHHNRPLTTLKLHEKPLLPRSEWWSRAACLGLIADKCRDLARSPVRLKYWWRPPAVNEAVGGAPESDHVDACAVDLVFRSIAAKKRALNYLNALYRTGLFDLSLGTYGAKSKTVHVGMYSPRGHRRWRK